MDSTRKKLEAAIAAVEKEHVKLFDECKFLKNHNFNHELRYKRAIYDTLGDVIYHFKKCLNDNVSEHDLKNEKILISF